MAGDTKADYDANYRFGAEGEWGRDDAHLRPEVKLHYLRSVQQPMAVALWDLLISYLGLTASDVLVVAGAGYGWSIEHIEVALPGINVVGVDISDYIAAEAGNTDESEIAEAILAVGLDPLTGRGLQIMQRWSTPGRNKNDNIVVLTEDMKSNQSRNRVRQALGNTTPTHIISENVMSTNTTDLLDQEILDWTTELNKLTSTEVIHLMTVDGVDLSNSVRTAEEVFALTGHRTILARPNTGILKDITA